MPERSPDLGSVILIDLTGDIVNKPPLFTSPASFAIYEGSTTIGSVNAGSGATYSLYAADDYRQFSINPNSGVLSFISAPDFEQPSDSDADNIYRIVVRAAKGSLYAYQEINIYVIDIYEGPVFFSPDRFNILSKTSFVGHVYAGEGTVYTIVNGPDSRLLVIDYYSGALSFRDAPDFDNPTDADRNNVYEILVLAQQGGLEASQYILITVVKEMPKFPQ
jgi:uncharacterized protein (DUF779 family)